MLDMLAVQNEAVRLIGSPYLAGGRGGYGFDCVGLVIHLLETGGSGIELTHQIVDTDFKTHIRLLVKHCVRAKPSEGSIALAESSGGVKHCGFMLMEGEILHSHPRVGKVAVNPYPGFYFPEGYTRFYYVKP